MNGIKEKVQVNPEENGDSRNPEHPSSHIHSRRSLGTLSEQWGSSPYLHTQHDEPLGLELAVEPAAGSSRDRRERNCQKFS